jgi:hypothetical protein
MRIDSDTEVTLKIKWLMINDEENKLVQTKIE